MKLSMAVCSRVRQMAELIIFITLPSAPYPRIVLNFGLQNVAKFIFTFLLLPQLKEANPKQIGLTFGQFGEASFPNPKNYCIFTENLQHIFLKWGGGATYMDCMWRISHTQRSACLHVHIRHTNTPVSHHACMPDSLQKGLAESFTVEYIACQIHKFCEEGELKLKTTAFPKLAVITSRNILATLGK